MVQSGPALPDPPDSCTRSSMEVSLDLLPNSEYIISFQPLSPGPCVVWLYMYVCGLPGPLLICPRPANGLPSDHGCLLYFCLHQLNSDHPLPPAGPNQAPAPTLSSPWRGPRAWDKRGHWVLVD
ncbi:unnamed protein product [Pleuronectes platessa]|uniref:Uncharacterized protein n=1 Tax=Pleuronectes platessa TaxID=8262 RepID=A0A9N7VH76_PLEPL|nr:unnamed protein product [Pleuronectes platessa]